MRYCQTMVICAGALCPEAFVAVTVSCTFAVKFLVTVQLLVVLLVQAPAHVYPVRLGELVQFAVTVTDVPTLTDEAGFALGVQTGTLPPPPLVTQVTVCVGAVPEI
jgi:hypothetical protein